MRKHCCAGCRAFAALKKGALNCTAWPSFTFFSTISGAAQAGQVSSMTLAFEPAECCLQYYQKPLQGANSDLI